MLSVTLQVRSDWKVYKRKNEACIFGGFSFKTTKPTIITVGIEFLNYVDFIYTSEDQRHSISERN